MPDLKRCFESAGFSDVLTVLGSGNVAFSVRTAPAEGLARRAEKAMHAELGRTFSTIIRPTQYLDDLIAAEPFAAFDLAATAKRVVTFLRQPTESSVTLPIERDGASILKLAAAEVFSAYVPNEKGPVFMNLLERTFGKDITTRTFETVQKCARA
jgi:uncharacterized protein (DUF1697 family)